MTGNVGNGRIVSNSMRISITVGSNAQIISSADPLNRWFQKSLSPGSGNTLVLTNSGASSFGSFDLNQLIVIVQGIDPDSLAAITGSISYLPGNNPALAGAANSSHGNANLVNDNSSTSLTVTNPLLVGLKDFSAFSDSCKIQLTWSTLSEENFNGFELEYSSNGIVYTKIDSIPGIGAKNTGSSYKSSFEQNVSKGYYRLRMIDKDGSVAFSKILVVATKCNEPKVLIKPRILSLQKNKSVKSNR